MRVAVRVAEYRPVCNEAKAVGPHGQDACVAVCCSVCCSVLQCVVSCVETVGLDCHCRYAVKENLDFTCIVCCTVLQCVAENPDFTCRVCCSVLQKISLDLQTVLQCVAVYCSVLQCVAENLT